MQTTLSYGRDSRSAIMRHVRWGFITVVLAGVVTALVSGFLPQILYLSQQRQWVGYHFPAGDKVFGPDVHPVQSGPPRSAKAIEPVIQPTNTICFLHGRRSSSGAERLLVADLSCETFSGTGPTMVTIRVSVYSVASWRIGSRVELLKSSNVDIQFSDTEELTVFAGQVDAADPSHFSFNYQLLSDSTEVGTIDCWLNADDTIRFREAVRKKPAK